MRLRVIVLVVAVTAASAIGAASARGATAPCKTSGLVVWLNTSGNATAGSVYYTLEFTNQSGHACTLHGYPGVSALDLRGHQLGSPGSRDPSAQRVVHLMNGATAKATLRIAVAGNFPPAACHRRAAAALRVYPPNQTVPRVVPLPFEACSTAGPVYLSVKAVQ